MPGTLKWFIDINSFIHGGFPGGSDSKELPGMQENLHSVPGLGRSSGEGNGYPVQYSCLENSMEKEPGGLQPMGLQRVGHN